MSREDCQLSRTAYLEMVEISGSTPGKGNGLLPEGGVSKCRRRDGTTARSPSGAVKVRDGPPLAGRWALQGEICVIRVGGRRRGRPG